MIKLITAPHCAECEFFNPEVNTIERRNSENQSKFDHYIEYIYKRCCSKNEHAITKDILLRLHETGGCGERDGYFKGWDDAITEAIRIVEDVSGVSVEEIL